MHEINEIETSLKDCEGAIATAAMDYGKIAVSAARARADYDLAYAQELLKISADGEKRTVGEKEALTLIAVQSLFMDCRIREAEADALKRRIGALQSVLTSLQTRASLIKTERSLTNYT
ncbi:MAG: hypothetical protein KF855_03200 [Acidobacteria bacterium]|nr:hypothetical protein [Acidobacteriota bacterium]